MLKKIIGIGVVFVTIVLIVIMVKSKKRPSFDQEQKSPELKLIMEVFLLLKKVSLLQLMAMSWQNGKLKLKVK